MKTISRENAVGNVNRAGEFSYSLVALQNVNDNAILKHLGVSKAFLLVFMKAFLTLEDISTLLSHL